MIPSVYNEYTGIAQIKTMPRDIYCTSLYKEHMCRAYNYANYAFNPREKLRTQRWGAHKYKNENYLKETLAFFLFLC